MIERDLQDYLFENPSVLFPDQIVSRKRREVFIEGRRIDLVFDVGGTQYIVELKRDTIKREDIGQVFEYYGLMRQSAAATNFKMILVAPSIPSYRRIPLEEFGIRCVEVPEWPKSVYRQAELLKNAVAIQKRSRSDSISPTPLLNNLNPLRFEDIRPPVSSTPLHISHQLLADGLPFVQKTFSEYEILPVRMAQIFDVLCFPGASPKSGIRFVRGGAWWAFSFGHAETMPKNNVPNISVNTLPWGLDLGINAELHPSQEVMRQKIERYPATFDRLVLEHGTLRLQAWLKLEHQPRFYHWIPLLTKPQGTWQGHDLLDFYSRSKREFAALRATWLRRIRDQKPEMTARQIDHMERTNRKLNLAWRFVHCFDEEDSLWGQQYDEQKIRLGAE